MERDLVVVKETDMQTKRNTRKPTTLLDMLRDEGNRSTILSSSELVRRYLKILEDAPEPVHALILQMSTDKDIGFGRQADHVRHIFSKTMKIDISGEEVDTLALVATIELALSSPIPMRFLRDRRDNDSAISKWMLKNMSPAALNLIDLNDFYSTVDIGNQINELDDAVQIVGTRQKVLAAVGITGELANRILINDIRKLNTELSSGRRSDDADVKSSVKDYIHILEKSKMEVRIGPEDMPSRS